MKIHLSVKLKIPNTTAITAFHTLQKMDFREVRKVERYDFYEFDVLRDAEKFMKEIVKVDILVNANKHVAEICKAGEEPKEGGVKLLVVDKGENASGLLSTLRERLGFFDIASMRKGVLWKLSIEGSNQKQIAEKIAKELLHSPHYQEYSIL